MYIPQMGGHLEICTSRMAPGGQSIDRANAFLSLQQQSHCVSVAALEMVTHRPDRIHIEPRYNCLLSSRSETALPEISGCRDPDKLEVRTSRRQLHHCGRNLSHPATTRLSERALTQSSILLTSSSESEQDHHELQNNQNMVAGSSLRRHRPSHPPTTDQHQDSDSISIRTKRNRAVSIPEHQELHKRRKLANNSQPQKLRIPLRGRTGLPKSVPVPAGELPTPATSVDSPTPKAQYDQFRRVEEKARAAIREHKSDEDDRRKLRSEHGGSRSKTELAQYFPNFEDMLSLDPPDPGILTLPSTTDLY